MRLRDGWACFVWHAKMERELDRWSQRYAIALRKHLKLGSRASLQTALRMGNDALALGLGMREMARIHQQALTVLERYRRKTRMNGRVENFFTKACTRVMEAHDYEPANKITLNRLKDMTNRRAAKLKTGNRDSKRGMAQRKARDHAFQKSGDHQSKCLDEALQLQKHLQRGSHRVLAAQEEERHKISHELQDEIAQTLLGLNVRLLSLRQRARTKFKGLNNEIASAQRLVVKSAESVRRFARKLDNYREGQSNRPGTVT
jgi:signal transduction histidine kinase